MVPGISFSGAIRDGRNKQRGWAGEERALGGAEEGETEWEKSEVSWDSWPLSALHS